MASTEIETGYSRSVFTGSVGLASLTAEGSLDATHAFLASSHNRPEVEVALRIRAVETSLYDLFGLGKLHGTIHTCVGQEFSGALMGKHLRRNDFVTSNHRCHGHFIAATRDWRGLIDELVGNEDGVCAGIGSSQHLWAKNFLSNGQQGGLLPVAAGIALDRKTKGEAGVVVSYLGEGTLGEGIVYETLNLDSLWNLPHVVICENNFYSQSTPQANSVAGQVAERARGFGVKAVSADTWDLGNLDYVLGEAMERARNECLPTFVTLATYRLNPHSKGDDTRPAAEIAWFRERDPATLAIRDYPQFATQYKEFQAEAADTIALALTKPPLRSARYFVDQLPRPAVGDPVSWIALPANVEEDRRTAQQLNSFYTKWLEMDPDAFFIGEDIEDPYGGAFKISKGMTTRFGERVRTTPISEAAITGIGIGLAVTGRRALVEIMFGDFITYAFDQIVNNASKMFNMYNQKLSCPVIVRTPMGGRRGYGPTHSQSLERFLVGIDNVCTVSLNSLAQVAVLLARVDELRCPVILLENKSDYTARTFVAPAGYMLKTDGSLLPTLSLKPQSTAPTVTLLAYGGMARFLADELLQVFDQSDSIVELIVPLALSPIHLAPIVESVRQTGRILVVEEGAGFASVGAEILAQLQEHLGPTFSAKRISGKPMPIPSAPSLESDALPSIAEVCAAILSLSERSV